jgi:type II secretory pathway pseudopilin PulG
VSLIALIIVIFLSARAVPQVAQGVPGQRKKVARHLNSGHVGLE